MSKSFKSFLSALVFATSIYSLPSTFAAPSPVRTPTEQENEQIAKQIKAINEQRNPVEASKLIAGLHKLPFPRVAQFALKKLSDEFAKEKPNTFHVVEYLNVLESMTAVIDPQSFEKVYQTFNASTFTSKKRESMEKSFQSISAKIPATAAVSTTDENTAQPEQPQEDSFKAQLIKDASDITNEKKMEAAQVLLMVVTDFMTDAVKKHMDEGTLVNIMGRDKETDQGINTLVRIKGKNPMFIGIPGVGKTAAAERMAQIIVQKQYPQTDVFRYAFDNAVMIQVTPAKISRLAKSNDPNSMALAIETFFDAVLYYEDFYTKAGQRKPIFVFIDEFHTLTQSQVEALLPYMDSRDKGISVFGASNSDKFQLAFKDNEALLRRVEQIGLVEFDEKQTIEILKASWVPVIEKKYNVKFSDEAIEAAVKVAPVLQPDTARPDGPFKVLQGLAIDTHREAQGKASEIVDVAVYDYAKKITGLPVNPYDGKAFQSYLEQKEKEINDIVVEQKSIVRKLVERVGNLMVGTPKRPQVMAVIGTTGTGKSLIAESVAEKVFGSKRKALLIDGNDYQSGGLSLNTLLGAPNGTVTSDKKSGVLCEYLDDPSRGKMGGVIVINEAEKMHPDGWKKLMEFFDKGVLTCGDGKIRKANRHIVILTSNRGAKIVFPDTVTRWTQKEIDQRVESFKSKDIAALFKQKTDGDDEFQLPPEVLGRVDEWTIANPGSHEGAVEVGHREMNRIKAEIRDLYHIELDVSAAVIEHLALTGFSVTDGYRHVAKQTDSYMKVIMRETRANWDIPRKGVIKVDLLKDENSMEVKFVVTSPVSAKPLIIEAPEQKFYNPLQDKEVLEKLKNMPKKLKGRIIGQDAAITSTADAVLSKYADVGRKTAVSLAIVGPTGVGKTELFKGVAEAVYDDAEKVQLIPLGDANFEGKLNDVFNSPTGYVGSNKIGKFEKALMNTPDGGVIVFDEFSNMGGGDPKVKEAMLKQYFYPILDEGSWTSTATGKTYDLRKYIFGFTGNDMQELFSGLNTDKQRLDAYNEANSKVKIRAALVHNGVPEAFLGRLSDVILAKPLLSTEAKGVTDKELRNQTTRLAGQHRNLKINYDQKFVDDFTRAFFSPDTGGRSVKIALDNRLGALVGAALIETGEAGKNLEGYSFRLQMSDNLTTKPYRMSHAPERKVVLGVEIYKQGKKVGYVEKDFTEFVPEVSIPLARQAEATAYHEAGHAVMNDQALTDQILDFITIRQAQIRGSDGKLMKALGYASYKPVPGADGNLNFEKTIAVLAKLWAGQLAQQMGGFPPDTGWSQDLKMMRTITTKFLTTWGLEAELVGIALDKDGNPSLTGKQRDLFEQKQKDLMELGRNVAEEGLKQRWVLVRAIVAELMRKGDIDQAQAKALAEKIAAKERNKANVVDYQAWQQRKAKSTYVDPNQKCDSWLLDTIKAQMTKK